MTLRSRPVARALVAMPLAFAAASLLATPFPRVARADEAPENPASMLRRARAAETADRDVAKAIELYRAVVASGGTSDAARDAALRLAELHEVRGERGAAVEDLKLVTERFSDRLDDATKRRVHESLARLLPAGSHARSPLGDVYVLPTPGAAANPVGSPLETKILAILSRLDEALPGDRPTVEYAVQSALEPVGLEALPVLERVMNGDRPERARFAAQAYARLGKAASLGGLVKAIREGDGFTRASAIGGLAVIAPGPGVSVPFVSAVTPLLEVPQVQDRRALLREALAPHLTNEDLLAREAAGGPDATYWLSVAVKRSLPEAVARVQAITKKGGALPPDVVRMLSQIAGGSTNVYDWNQAATLTPTNPGLSGSLRLAMLEAVASQVATPETAEACGAIGGVITRSGAAEEAAHASEVAWRHILSMSDVTQRSSGMLTLARYGVPPNVELLGDAAAMSAYMTALGVASRGGTFSNGRYIPQQLLGKPLQALPGFWEGLGGLLQTEAISPSTPMIGAWVNLQETPRPLPPPAMDARWIPVLERLAAQDYDYWGQVPWMVQAAARSGDPKFLSFVRSELAREGLQSGQRRSTLLEAVASRYAAADRGPFVAELLLAGIEDYGSLYPLLRTVLVDSAFWKRLLPDLAKAEDARIAKVMHVLSASQLGNPTSPSEVDGLLVPVARRAVSSSERLPEFLWRAIARSHEPEALALTKELATQADEVAAKRARSVLGYWNQAKADANVVFLESLLHDPATTTLFSDQNPGSSASKLVALLGTSPEGAPKVASLARDPRAPAAPAAVRALVEGGPAGRVTLAGIFTSGGWKDSLLPTVWNWRLALVSAAKKLHLTEAIPFLLQEFQGGMSHLAAEAMDDIRAYHERLAAFQGYTVGSQTAIQSVLEMLDVEDPDIRRAAVLSYAALAGKEALPRLLKIAQSEKDQGVRAEALDAINRIYFAAMEPRPAPDTKPVPAPVPAPEAPGNPEDAPPK